MTSRIETKEPAATAGAATPRPWRAMTTGSVGCSIVADGVLLPRVARLASGPYETCKADSALIVAAVNDYDRLRRIEAAARDLIQEFDDGGEAFALYQRALRAALTSSTPEKP